MRRGGFSDEQIVAILKEHAAGLSTAEWCRKHGIREATAFAGAARGASSGGGAGRRRRAVARVEAMGKARAFSHRGQDDSGFLRQGRGLLRCSIGDANFVLSPTKLRVFVRFFSCFHPPFGSGMPLESAR